MPTSSTPDPSAVAKAEAQAIARDRAFALERPLERIILDSPFLDAATVRRETLRFHRERMAKIPSAAKYPEAGPWVAYRLALDRELQQLANLSDEELALYRSVWDYVCFRGTAAAMPPRVERCRVLYAPETDRGQLHIKNVDDPAKHWKPHPPFNDRVSHHDHPLGSDGVGSGLHFDDEPEEIFPLPALVMCRAACTDVPGAVEFLTRYQSFWGRANLIVYDRQKRSVAIEKASYNFIEVFGPGPNGVSYISGMTCRNPDSPQGRYVQRQRDKYVTRFNRGEDGVDRKFWATARAFEDKLADAVRAMGRPAKSADIVRLFTTPWPQGLNKTGSRVHEDQALVAYTLQTVAVFHDERRYHRWQRTEPPELSYPAQPEVYDL